MRYTPILVVAILLMRGRWQKFKEEVMGHFETETETEPITEPDPPGIEIDINITVKVPVNAASELLSKLLMNGV